MPKACPVEDRFWTKVDKTSDSGGCWLWTAQIARNGYGVIKVNRQPRGAHVVAYELLVGPVPAGKELHHRCEVKACVRPGHTEPKTKPEHMAEHAPTHCLNGHELAAANVYVGRDGARYCLICRRERDRSRYQKRQEQRRTPEGREQMREYWREYRRRKRERAA